VPRTSRLKCWMGNLDGSRQGLVISVSKREAAKAVGCSQGDFEKYWREARSWTGAFEINRLYTRRYDSKGEWFEGRCRA
jgi:hypothetical protein